MGQLYKVWLNSILVCPSYTWPYLYYKQSSTLASGSYLSYLDRKYSWPMAPGGSYLSYLDRKYLWSMAPSGSYLSYLDRKYSWSMAPIESPNSASTFWKSTRAMCPSSMKSKHCIPSRMAWYGSSNYERQQQSKQYN